MKLYNYAVLSLLILMTGCASNTDYFYPNTGLQSDEIEKMRYEEVVGLGDKAYQDGFYRESSRLFMTARRLAGEQNIVDQSILDANLQKEYQSEFKVDQLRLKNAIARYGDTHAEVADREFQLAKSYAAIGQPDQAEIRYQRAIDIGEIVLAPGASALETYYSMMGYLMRDNGQHAKSLIYYDKATSGDIDAYSPHPQARSAAHYNYGVAYKGLGQRSKAFDSMNKAWLECQKFMHREGNNKDFCNIIKSLRDELEN